jgi:calcineurin-like phosphoesterase
VLLAAAAIVAAALSRGPTPEIVEGHAYAIPSGDDRTVVEVLNASGRSGLARSATRMLRRAGVDVVYLGNAAFDTLTVTVVLARRGDSLRAVRVADLLGAVRTAVQLDTARRVDATVLLGRDFRPAPEYHP